MAGHDYKDWPQTSSRCHSCGQEPFGCSTVKLATFHAQRVYRHTDGCSLKGWLLWKKSNTPAAGVPTLAQQPEGNPVVSFSWFLLLARHIPLSSTSTFRCLWWRPFHNKHIFWSLAYLRYLLVQHFFCCTSPQVITSKLSTPFVNFRHDVAFLKIGSEISQLL